MALSLEGGREGPGSLILLFSVSVSNGLGRYLSAPLLLCKNTTQQLSLGQLLNGGSPRDSLAQPSWLQTLGPGSQLCLLPTASFPLVPQSIWVSKDQARCTQQLPGPMDSESWRTLCGERTFAVDANLTVHHGILSSSLSCRLSETLAFWVLLLLQATGPIFQIREMRALVERAASERRF